MLGRLRYWLFLLNHPTQRRHAWRWLASHQSDYWLRWRQPWLVFDVIDWLSALDLTDRRVFEYGSGGSTLFWLDRGARVVSVEHDAGWYARVRAQVAMGAALDYRLAPAEAAATDVDPADPAAYGSADASFRTFTFRRYVSQIDEFPDGRFDLVLVDGRARPACIAHAAPKIKPGGWLIVDDSDRDYYFARTRLCLENFTVTKFRGAVAASQTLCEASLLQRMH